jgi:hypothetical protein
MLPAMEPAQALADKTKDSEPKATAPNAAHWLAHPCVEQRQVSMASRLAAEEPWTGSWAGDDDL